jgi:hypothetical protein
VILFPEITGYNGCMRNLKLSEVEVLVTRAEYAYNNIVKGQATALQFEDVANAISALRDMVSEAETLRRENADRDCAEIEDGHRIEELENDVYDLMEELRMMREEAKDRAADKRFEDKA